MKLRKATPLKKGDLVALCDFGRPQRAEVIGVDKRSKCYTFCIVPEDRIEGDVDGLAEGGHEDVFVLVPASPL